MSKYTTQVRWLVEMNSPKDMSMSKRISFASPLIFDFDYPIWSQEYKRELEKKILMHYINKEIGFETVGLWKLYLEERLNLIMPYYNELYETATRKYDYMIDVDETEKYEGDKKAYGNVDEIVESTQSSSGYAETSGSVNHDESADSSSEKRSLASDLPQANYGGIDYGTNLQEDDTTTSNTVESRTNSDSSTTSSTDNELTGNNKTSTSSQTQDLYTRTRSGLTGARSSTQLLMEYRQSLINIDKMLIEELYDLFMLIY